ncbi:MAG: transcription factor TFIIIC, partial [Thermoprotei archaeon]
MRRRLSDLEKRIIEILETAGDEGLLQRELWNILGIDSRSGMRVVARL